MNLVTIIATMNLKDHATLLNKMNIQGSSVVINQMTDDKATPIEDISKGSHRLYSYRERGLSRSRNRAIEKIDKGLLLISDDDMQYEDSYPDIIKDGFKKYPQADIVAFRVDEMGSGHSYRHKEGRVSTLHTMKLASVQLAIKKSSLDAIGLRFNEDFGAGTKNPMGEENILLGIAAKSGLKIYSHPVIIGNLTERESTWFKGYTPHYFYTKGRVFATIFPLIAPLLAIRFAIVKHPMYSGESSFITALTRMIKGVYGKQ